MSEWTMSAALNRAQLTQALAAFEAVGHEVGVLKRTP